MTFYLINNSDNNKQTHAHNFFFFLILEKQKKMGKKNLLTINVLIVENVCVHGQCNDISEYLLTPSPLESTLKRRTHF